ncbi:hypothetical protein [Nostoc sp.]|uniref:hypothetical protein n=1 Tax=Nostoc sp. TaxID=1180 RepID=UPI002FFB4141
MCIFIVLNYYLLAIACASYVSFIVLKYQELAIACASCVSPGSIWLFRCRLFLQEACEEWQYLDI